MKQARVINILLLILWTKKGQLNMIKCTNSTEKNLNAHI